MLTAYETIGSSRPSLSTFVNTFDGCSPLSNFSLSLKGNLWEKDGLLNLLKDMCSRLPLVRDILYMRGNEEFVGGRGNLRGKGDKIGELLENVRGLDQKSNEDKN